jgi:hypothetical protein
VAAGGARVRRAALGDRGDRPDRAHRGHGTLGGRFVEARGDPAAGTR